MSSTALRSSYLRSVLRPVVFVSLAFLLALPLLADSHVRIVRLSYVDGDVQLDKADGRGFGTAYLNMPIVNQSKLWARDGQAEVELEDGSSIRLTPDTIVAFNDLSLDNNGGHNTSVELQQGTAYFDIRYRDSDHFQLGFGRNHVSLDKSARFRVNVDKHDFEVAVLSGEIEVENASNAEVAVKKGETIRLDSDDPDRYYLAKGVDAENYDDWDNDRAKWHDEAVASNSYQNGNGISDLGMYGNYFYVPGYGNMWRPYSVGLGWDPFADGYWISYPGFGYTFVSGYPWGWAPYRYGSWQFINGYGWCWHPGSNWNNWQTVPPVYNVPPHYRPPMPPYHHGSPVMVVDNGRVSPLPHRHMIVDNDAIEHHRPIATKVTAANGEVVQQGSTQPAQGFVGRPGFTSTAPATGVTIAPTPRITGPRSNGPRWADGEHVPREVQSPRAQTPAMSVVSPRPTSAPVSVPAAAPPRPMPTPPVQMAPPVRNDRPMMPSPRMEPRSSAPPMHTSGMSSGAAMSHPSMSSGGGMRMSAPSMGGGGGMRGGGGGGGGSSHGSHR